MLMDFNLNQKKVLVTGSTKGIGLEIAKKFLDNSCKVVINSNNSSNLKKIQNKFKNENTFIYKADLTKDTEIKELITYSYKVMKGLDILVCNYGDGRKIKDNGKEDYSDWINSLKVNLLSTTSCVYHSIKFLKKSPFPSILCISSICGINASAAPLDYSSSKSAINLFVKNQSKNLSKYNIRINSISPGNIYSKDGRWPNKFIKDKKLKSKIIQKIPLRRFGTTEEIANAALFLSSPLSSFTTGANLTIDGGQTD